MPDINPQEFIVMIAVILLSISIHEFAHAKMADAAGDPTPSFYGRVTLNPLAHLDPIGTLMVVITTASGFGIGWGKPVLVNPSKMRNPRWDHFASVAAGPASNMLQATIYAIFLRLMIRMDGAGPEWIVIAGRGEAGIIPLVLLYGVLINIGLCLFNLIPLGPLDGHWMVGAFMPEPMRIRWYQWNRRVGGFAFIALVLIGQIEPRLSLIDMVLFPAVSSIFGFLVGV